VDRNKHRHNIRTGPQPALSYGHSSFPSPASCFHGVEFVCDRSSMPKTSKRLLPCGLFGNVTTAGKTELSKIEFFCVHSQLSSGLRDTRAELRSFLKVFPFLLPQFFPTVLAF
jgi:hypothetical protein